MTTEKDIDEQIAAEVKVFNDSIYDGHMPTEFMEMFKKSIMAIPPAQHKYNITFIKSCTEKRYNEVSRSEVGVMINMIYATRPHLIYDSLDMFFKYTLMFDKVRDEYNKTTAAFERKMIKKRELKMALINKTAPFNQLNVM